TPSRLPALAAARRCNPARPDGRGLLAASGQLVLGGRLRVHAEHRQRRLPALRAASVRGTQSARPQSRVLRLLAALRPACGAVLLGDAPDTPPERLAAVPRAARPHG